jgi:hypothetical protein
MSEDQLKLVERMTRLSEAELMDMLERTAEYRPEFIQAANTEVANRGGIEALRQRVAEKAEPNEVGQNQAGQSSPRMQSFVGMWPPLIPDRARFGNYPVLRFIAGVFRVLALLAAVVLLVGILFGVYGAFFSSGSVALPMFFLAVYLAVAAIGLLAVSEVMCILVDIERNTR